MICKIHIKNNNIPSKCKLINRSEISEELFGVERFSQDFLYILYARIPKNF